MQLAREVLGTTMPALRNRVHDSGARVSLARDLRRIHDEIRGELSELRFRLIEAQEDLRWAKTACVELRAWLAELASDKAPVPEFVPPDDEDE